MKKRTVTALSFLLIAVLCCATVVYAFFHVIMPIGDEPEFSAEGSPLKEVYTEQQLFEAVSKEGLYNPHGGISEGEKRVTVKFTGDITLTSDLFITADVHVDFGGYKLFMNGFSVTVMHDYAGAVMIKGFEPNSQGDIIYINTPNAFLAVCDNDNKIIEKEDYQDYIVDISGDKRVIVYNIFYMIANLLKSGYSHNLKLINYGELIEEYALDDYAFDYGAIEFNNASYYCPFDEKDECFDYYLSGDVDLPLSYHNYPIKITYSCDPVGFISDKGKVNPLQSEVKEVTLTASVSFEGEDAAYDASYHYSIFLIHPQDAQNQQKLANARILDYLRAYEGEYDVDGDGQNIVSGYIFNGEISLPKSCGANGLSYIYKVFDQQNEASLIDGTQGLEEGASENGYFRVVGDAYVFAVSADTRFLSVTCVLGGGSFSSGYLPIYGKSVTIEDNYTVAQKIISQWGLDKITITDNTAAGGRNGYTFKELPKDVFEFYGKGVLSVEYSLVNNVDGTYGIEGDILYVLAGKHPNELQRVFLTASFSFADSQTVNMSIPVLYSASSTGGSQIHPFLPYYIYFNRMFEDSAGASTILTFDMPINYPSGGPAVVYDITGDELGAITLQLFYGGSAHNLELGSFTSYTQAFDGYLEDISLTLSQFINNYSDAKWTFNIDIDKIGKIDNNISLKYNYKFDYSSANWTLYAPADDSAAESSFILPGILRTVYKNDTIDSAGVPDAVLYKWIYDNYNTSGDSYTFSSDKFTKYILTSWLTKETVLDNSDGNKIKDDNGVKISNYKGIEFLTGVRVLKLSNIGISTSQNMNAWLTVINYISQMSGLEELYLSNNALYDRAQSNFAFPTGDDNDFIGILSALSNLKILDLSKNKIFDFSDLTAFASLERVYTYDNYHTANFWFFSDFFTALSNGTYGSEGSVNLAVYQQLYSEKGVQIHHIENQTFSGGSGDSDYAKMRNISYQDKLPQNVPISSVYEFLSTNPAHYGIIMPSDGSGYTVDENSWLISFSYEGSAGEATEFIMTYSYTMVFDRSDIPDVTVSITAKFSVTRIAEGE